MSGLARYGALGALSFLVAASPACATQGLHEALDLAPETLARKQLQTRVYDTGDEAAILAACAHVLQDLGFNLDRTERRLGILTASKERSAAEIGQYVAAIAVTMLAGTPPPVDSHQKIRASIVTRPTGGRAAQVAVRVTFQRMVWDTQGNVSKMQTLEEPWMYEDFFARLSKSIFLDAHEI